MEKQDQDKLFSIHNKVDDKLISSWGIDKDTFSTWVENEETSIIR